MSGLIADAKTLIDKARVETQVWILSCGVSWAVAWIWSSVTFNLCISISEPLVHLQRDYDCGKRDSGRVQPGAAVRRGGRRPRCHGQSPKPSPSFLYRVQMSEAAQGVFNCLMFFSVFCSEPTFWCCVIVRGSGWKRTPAVCFHNFATIILKCFIHMYVLV